MKQPILILSLFAALALASCGETQPAASSSSPAEASSSLSASSSVEVSSSQAPEASSSEEASSSQDPEISSEEVSSSSVESSSSAAGMTFKQWSAAVADAEKDSEYPEYRSVSSQGSYADGDSSLTGIDVSFGVNWNSGGYVDEIFYNDEQEQIFESYDADSKTNPDEVIKLHVSYLAANYCLTSYGYLSSETAAFFAFYVGADFEAGEEGFSFHYEDALSSTSYEWNSDLLLTKAEVTLIGFTCSMTFAWSKERLPDTTYSDEKDDGGDKDKLACAGTWVGTLQDKDEEGEDVEGSTREATIVLNSDLSGSYNGVAGTWILFEGNALGDYRFIDPSEDQEFDVWFAYDAENDTATVTWRNMYGEDTSVGTVTRAE